MDTPGPSIYIAMVLLVACSAFFSASETAISSFNKIRMRSKAEDGNKRAKTALKVAEDFDKVIISPGPGIPSEAGGMPDFIRRYGHRVSMLGVCLGHHAIAEVFGARLVNTPIVFHGVRSRVELCGRPYIFDGLPDSIEVGRYHSWVVSDDGFPDCLRVTARAEGGEIMALSHVSYDLHGVQFHPESIMTPCGRDILKNFLFH